MKSMAAGEPLDLQRNKRWPAKTGAGAGTRMKVQFTPEEEDSDYSDMEGLMPPTNGYDPVTGNLRSADVPEH